MPGALDSKTKSEIVDRLFTVFRDRGYEGSSLADLSRATGLGKSSLYHHFPRGKEQMAEIVLEHGRDFIQSAVVDVATSQGTLRSRVGRIAMALDQLYAGGRNACVLGKLAIADIGIAGHQLARDIFEMWTFAIAELARDSGMPPARASRFAEDWIARVQGALILQAASGDRKPFERAMRALLDLAANSTKAAQPRKVS